MMTEVFISQLLKLSGLSRRRRNARAQILFTERVGMQATPVDFHAMQLFQPYIAEPHLWSEVIQQRELARLVGRLEGDDLQVKCLGEAIGQPAIKISVVVEQADSFGALAGFHHQLACSGVQPAAPLCDERL